MANLFKNLISFFTLIVLFLYFLRFFDEIIYFAPLLSASGIKFAVKNAEPNEIILIAGKGHEKEQIYKNKTISISDKQIVKKLKFSPKKVSKRNQIFLQNKKILETITNISKVKNFDGLAIDSREVKNDNLFLTIKGKINDGANFIAVARFPML